jgi:hypothetical protein
LNLRELEKNEGLSLNHFVHRVEENGERKEKKKEKSYQNH